MILSRHLSALAARFFATAAATIFTITREPAAPSLFRHREVDERLARKIIKDLTADGGTEV